MQAIQVKVLPQTETKPRRLKAWCMAGSVTCSYYTVSYYGDELEIYRSVARALQQKLGWDYDLLGGTLPNGDMVFVQTARDPRR